MKEEIKNTRGITLIALVITIIILLILAGVTINIALSNNGLFNKSKQAVEKYKASEKNETGEMDKIDDELGKLLGSKTSEVISKITGGEIENTTVEISGKNVTIPAGFTISPESSESVDGGIVVVDNAGNEWVWIPCTDFSRKDFGKQTGTYSDYSEEMPEEQRASATKYGGYYIGRYEAGNDGSDNVIIQKNKTPYNNIAIADCKKKSSSFASDNNYDTNKMFTVLCSSYAWDTSITFIEKTNAGYATNSPQGNYLDTEYVNGEKLINTGLTTPVCNIYDMGGNLWEFTTEFSSSTLGNFAIRGGYYRNGKSVCSAGRRAPNVGDANVGDGFRPTLFLK